MLILGQNDLFCGHNVVNFSVWFFQLTVFKYLVASHVTEPGSLLTEPGAAIKFSHVCYKCILSTLIAEVHLNSTVHHTPVPRVLMYETVSAQWWFNMVSWTTSFFITIKIWISVWTPIKCEQEKRRETSKYHRLPRSVYVQRFKTETGGIVKQSL